MSTSRDSRHAPRVALLAILLTCALSSDAMAQSSCDDVESCYEDGLAAFIGGDYGRAILLWQLGYKLDPNDGLFPYSMVTAYARTGQYEKAINLSRNVTSKHSSLGDKKLTKNLARRLSYSSAIAAQKVADDLLATPKNTLTPPPTVTPSGYSFPSGRGIVGIGLTVVGAGLLGGMAAMNSQYGYQKFCVEEPNHPDNLTACPRPEVDYETFCNSAAADPTDPRVSAVCGMDATDRNIGTAITRDNAETSRFIGLGLLLSGIVVSGAGLTLVIVDVLGASPPTSAKPAEASITPVFAVQPDGAYTGFQWRF